MVTGILQTFMLRLFVKFKTCLQWNLEFTLVMLIVDSKLVHYYLTSVCLMSHICLYFHSEFALNTFIHTSWFVSSWMKCYQSFDSICPPWIEFYSYFIDTATGELDIGSWFVTQPTLTITPPGTLPSWIIKANPSCYTILGIITQNTLFLIHTSSYSVDIYSEYTGHNSP